MSCGLEPDRAALLRRRAERQFSPPRFLQGLARLPAKRKPPPALADRRRNKRPNETQRG